MRLRKKVYLKHECLGKNRTELNESKHFKLEMAHEVVAPLANFPPLVLIATAV